MRDARFYEEQTVPHEVFPTQAAIQVSWEPVDWANRYSVYRKEGGKRILVGKTSVMTELYDRRAREAMPLYEVVAERIGDIAFEDLGFATVEGPARDAQDMAIRMQSDKADWKGHPTIGCDLGGFIGRRNTEETAAEVAEAVEAGLTAEGRFDAVEVRVVPVAIDRLSVYAFHEGAYAKEDMTL